MVNYMSLVIRSITSFFKQHIVLLAFVAEAILAGANGVAIRFSNRELAPIWGAGLRFSLAAVPMIVAMFMWKVTIPKGQLLWRAMLYGFFQFDV